jgi:tripartite ATP-independent transporter DctP family solute receptor
MKKLMTVLLVLTLACCVFAQGQAEKTKTELRWGSVHTPEQPVTSIIMMEAIDEINKNAEGIHISGFPNSALGNSGELVEGVKEGIVDIITEGPAQFQAWVPKAAQVEAPYLWKDVAHMQRALNGKYKEDFNKLFESVDVKILGTFYYGTRQLTTNKPIHTLKDLSGMKIRVPAAELYVKMVQSWGAAATPMALGELYLALQQGVVDGQENPLPTFNAQKFYEVIKYVIMTNHIICPNMVFINLDTWNALSTHDQKVVQDAVDKAIKKFDAKNLQDEATLAESLKKYGVEVIVPDNTIRDATIPAIKPLIADWDYIQTL